jgi:hypothetical protein
MVVSIKSWRESRVCVRYRHCERDAVDVGDGAPGVTRHPGLLHLLVCLCHVAKGACGRKLDAVAWNCDLASTRSRCWPLGVARAHSNVTSSAHAVLFSSFRTPSSLFTPRTNEMPQTS